MHDWGERVFCHQVTKCHLCECWYVQYINAPKSNERRVSMVGTICIALVQATKLQKRQEIYRRTRARCGKMLHYLWCPVGSRVDSQHNSVSNFLVSHPQPSLQVGIAKAVAPSGITVAYREF